MHVVGDVDLIFFIIGGGGGAVGARSWPFIRPVLRAKFEPRRGFRGASQNAESLQRLDQRRLFHYLTSLEPGKVSQGSTSSSQWWFIPCSFFASGKRSIRHVGLICVLLCGCRLGGWIVCETPVASAGVVGNWDSAAGKSKGGDKTRQVQSLLASKVRGPRGGSIGACEIAGPLRLLPVPTGFDTL